MATDIFTRNVKNMYILYIPLPIRSTDDGIHTNKE